MIADQGGGLVWFHPLPAGEDATNFQVQQYQGKPVLTWWQGRILEVGFGQGEDMLYDSSYRQIGTIHAGNGYHADLHEIRTDLRRHGLDRRVRPDRDEPILGARSRPTAC